MCVRFWLPCDPPSPPGDKSHLNWPSSSNTGTDEENRGYEGTVIFNANTFCGIALPMLRGWVQVKGSCEEADKGPDHHHFYQTGIVLHRKG